jgi:hypothetical protein
MMDECALDMIMQDFVSAECRVSASEHLTARAQQPAAKTT